MQLPSFGSLWMCSNRRPRTFQEVWKGARSRRWDRTRELLVELASMQCLEIASVRLLSFLRCHFKKSSKHCLRGVWCPSHWSNLEQHSLDCCTCQICAWHSSSWPLGPYCLHQFHITNHGKHSGRKWWRNCKDKTKLKVIIMKTSFFVYYHILCHLASSRFITFSLCFELFPSLYFTSGIVFLSDHDYKFCWMILEVSKPIDIHHGQIQICVQNFFQPEDIKQTNQTKAWRYRTSNFWNSWKSFRWITFWKCPRSSTTSNDFVSWSCCSVINWIKLRINAPRLFRDFLSALPRLRLGGHFSRARVVRLGRHDPQRCRLHRERRSWKVPWDHGSPSRPDDIRPKPRNHS